MEPSVTLFGPVDTLVGPYIEYIILVLVLANIGARALEYSQHVSQAEEGDEAISRGAARVATNALLVVTSFYYLTLHAHAGMVMSVLVLGMVITDVFEFESRKVEARQGWDLDRPMGAIGASVLVLLYAAFQSLFFIVAPIWDAII